MIPVPLNQLLIKYSSCGEEVEIKTVMADLRKLDKLVGDVVCSEFYNELERTAKEGIAIVRCHVVVRWLLESVDEVKAAVWHKEQLEINQKFDALVSECASELAKL